jgi:hypothetical protein
MTRAGTAVCLMTAVVLGSAIAAAARSEHNHHSTVSTPRVDVLDNGNVVVSLDAVGDLRGVMTLTLQPMADASYAGTWAFTVTHADTTDPETGLEPEPHTDAEGESHEHAEGDSAHEDFLRLVHRGSLSGSIAGAVLTFAADGTLDALTAPLTIAAGSNEFTGVTGSGTASLTGVSLVF